jgi:hypothetical protein
VIRSISVRFDEDSFDQSNDSSEEGTGVDDDLFIESNKADTMPMDTPSGGEDEEELSIIPPQQHDIDDIENEEIETNQPDLSSSPSQRSQRAPSLFDPSPGSSRHSHDNDDNIVVVSGPRSTRPRRTIKPTKAVEDNMDQQAQGLLRKGTYNGPTAHTAIKRSLHTVLIVGIRCPHPNPEDIIIPQTYAEAITLPQASEWKAAAYAEFKSLNENCT